MELPQHPRVRPLNVKNLLELKRPEVCSVMVGAKVMEALKVMGEHDVGAVVVLDGERVAGIFSERDYARMALVGADMTDATPVHQVMTNCVVFATPLQPVQRCLELMNEERLQYIPVIEDGKLRGLLSIVDLQKAIIA